MTDYIAANCNWTLHEDNGDYSLDNLKACVSLTQNRAYEWERELNLLLDQKASGTMYYMFYIDYIFPFIVYDDSGQYGNGIRPVAWKYINYSSNIGYTVSHLISRTDSVLKI